MNDDPRTFHIASDREGVFIEDDWGEEVTSWPPFFDRPFRDYAANDVEVMLDLMIKDFLEQELVGR